MAVPLCCVKDSSGVICLELWFVKASGEAERDSDYNCGAKLRITAVQKNPKMPEEKLNSYVSGESLKVDSPTRFCSNWETCSFLYFEKKKKTTVKRNEASWS